MRAAVWPMASVRGDVQRIIIGAGTNIQDNCTLHVTHAGAYTPHGRALLIGDYVTVGHQVLLHACTIGHSCLIGMGSIILDGACLDDGVMLGAGSLVPMHKKLTGGYLWLGQPVKKIRALTAEEKLFLHYSAQSYITLKNRYLAQP